MSVHTDAEANTEMLENDKKEEKVPLSWINNSVNDKPQNDFWPCSSPKRNPS